MTNNYPIGPIVYSAQNQGNNYNIEVKNKSSKPYAVGGLVAGAIGGAALGAYKNPFVDKAGEATDTFAKSVYEKYADKADDSVKKTYSEGNEILKKLDSIKTPEELRSLFNENKNAAENICRETGQTYNAFLDGINQENLAANKETIKEQLEAGNKMRYGDMKNKIKGLWNKEKKQFIEPTSGDRSVYNAIVEAKKGVKAKFIAKYAAIGAVVTGAVAFIAHKIISAKKSQPQQNV